MERLLRQPYIYQIELRLKQLNEFYTREVMIWVLTADYQDLLCDSERDAHRHAINIIDTYDARDVMEAFEHLYPDMIQFINLRNKVV